MPGTQDRDTVETLSYTPIGEDVKVTPGISPIPTPRTSTPKKNDEGINPPLPEVEEKTISSVLIDKTSSPLSPRNQDLLDSNTQVPPPSPSQTEGEETHISLSDMQESSGSRGSFDNGSEEHAYAELKLPPSEGSVHGESGEPMYTTIEPNTKSSKKSLDSGIDGQNSTLSRSVSERTVFDPPWDREKSEKDVLEKFNNSLTTSLLESDDTDSEMDSEIPLISPSKKTNRIWPRVKYALQQKSVIVFGATAIILSTSAALLYLQDKEKFIAFFTNSPKYITIPVIALAALLAISPIFCAIKQFRNTEEHSIQKKGADEILAEVLEYQPKDKAIKSVRLEYSNGTHSNFVLNAWEAKNDFINIDEKVVNRTNKIESVINNRPLFTTLLTGVGAASVALPLGLLATHGVNGVQKFYQNPLISNIGLSLLIGSGILALSMICLGVHYYRKTNCTNLIYSQEKIDPESVNKELIEEIKRERTSVLGENHSKDAKRISLTLERVVVQSHNCKDAVYSVS